MRQTGYSRNKARDWDDVSPLNLRQLNRRIVTFCMAGITFGFLLHLFAGFGIEDYQDRHQRLRKIAHDMEMRKAKVNSEDLYNSDDFKKRLEESQIRY